MTINGHELSEYGANLLREYTVGSNAISNSYFKGRSRSNFTLYMSDVGLKTLTLPVVFQGNSIAINKSRLDAELLGKSEVQMPDGYYYTVMMDDAGTLAYRSERLAECTYTLTGYQHGELVTVIGKTVQCTSTAPVTDCIVSVTAGADAERYPVQDAVFRNVKTGDVLTLDGINKRVLVNGGPAAQQCDFVQLPYLKPGANTLEAADPPTVQYYPIYL